MEKGITPVVAVILLLLITVAVIGFAFGFFQKILGLTGTAAEEEAIAVAERLSKGIEIENAKGTAITIKNTGTKNITPSTEIRIYVNDVEATCSSWNPTTLAGGSASVCTLTAACATNDIVKASGPANIDTAKCS